MQNKSQYILGTAQLGFNYGIANITGKPDINSAIAIVEAAYSSGCIGFDTAQGYGESEKFLGNALNALGISKDVKIFTKLHYPKTANGFSWVEDSVNNSLSKLKVDAIEAILLHDFSTLKYWDQGLGEILMKLLDSGKLAHLGVSLYSIDDLQVALNHPQMKIIQMPVNIFSPEVLLRKIIDKAFSIGKKIFARSLFLQGLLLMPSDKVAHKLPYAHEASKKWYSLSKEYATSPFELCMRFAAALKCPVILGSDTPEHAQKNSTFLNSKPLKIKDIQYLYEELKPYLSSKIINPSLWSKP